MTFIHWGVEPDVVCRLLPQGLSVDLYDGKAWVGLAAFEVRDFGLRGTPALPGISQYPETNLRTYVRNGDGVAGIWFLTLEVASPSTALAGRALLGIPYRWSRMEVTTADSGGCVRYVSTRRSFPFGNGRGPGHEITVEVDRTPIVAEDPLATFLTGRWRSFSMPFGRLVAVPVQHQPWTLHAARLDEFHEDLLADADIDIPEPPTHVCFSPGVDAVLGLPRFGSMGDRPDTARTRKAMGIRSSSLSNPN